MSQSPVSHSTAPERPPSATEGAIAVWAIGETRAMSERERRLTAAVYADLPGVVEHVGREGRLPERVPAAGPELRLRAIVVRRGIDVVLSPEEKEILDALAADADTARGRVVILGPRAVP